MDNESEKIIADQVKKLPKEVRDALTSDELHKKIVVIGEKHHLHIDQIGLLEDEVTLVMMGMADPQELADTMTTQMSVPKPEAESIASDVSQDIFLPIRDAMKKFTEQGPSVVMPSASNTVAPVPKSVPVSVVIPPKPVTPTPPPAPAVKPTEAHAELMLREATVSMPPKPATPAPTAPAPTSASASNAPAPTPAPKTGAPKPVAPYKADPYREPPE